MTTSTEFKVGKHNIGWINSNFEKEFENIEFASRPIPTFQKIPRAMNDKEIESELTPGLCDLGDVLAFLDNTPEECKDGYANLFYLENFVVRVYWDSFDRYWDVGAWDRDDSSWREDSRVFSPASSSSTKDSELGSSETLPLKTAIEIVKAEGIILVQDPHLIEMIIDAFPGWLVLTSNISKAIEFYPVPNP